MFQLYEAGDFNVRLRNMCFIRTLKSPQSFDKVKSYQIEKCCSLYIKLTLPWTLISP